MPYRNKEQKVEFMRLYQRRQRVRERDDAFKVLGGKCVHCGNDDYRVLQIDHIKPLLKTKGKHLGLRIKTGLANGTMSTDNLQLLCANCHQIKCHSERTTHYYVTPSLKYYDAEGKVIRCGVCQGEGHSGSVCSQRRYHNRTPEELHAHAVAMGKASGKARRLRQASDMHTPT